jgi:sigma-B regulation protein RsbU (phosphoserine phosphatase)
VGVIADAQFSVKEIMFEKNDMLLVFTDGVPDSKNGSDEFFGNAPLAAALIAGGTTPKELLESIEAQLHQFVGPEDQFDDITLLALKRVM